MRLKRRKNSVSVKRRQDQSKSQKFVSSGNPRQNAIICAIESSRLLGVAGHSEMIGETAPMAEAKVRAASSFTHESAPTKVVACYIEMDEGTTKHLIPHQEHHMNHVLHLR
jgi:hypothetical protein